LPNPTAANASRRARRLYLCPRQAQPLPAASQEVSAWWSRPFVSDVCSMFARMPRYTPAPLGIRSTARMRATGRNGSSRHVLALFDSSSRRINEQSSGLLIRRFGVQVPGGAPVLTWGFIKSRSSPRARFVPILIPCSLRACSAVGWWACGSLSKTDGKAPRVQRTQSARQL
jgi:hypothetical protein